MNYDEQSKQRFETHKQLAEEAFARQDFEEVLANIAAAGVIGYEQMQGTFTDPELENLLAESGSAIRQMIKTPDTATENPAEKCDVLVLATTVAYVGGHSQMIRKWLNVLNNNGQKTAFFSTELVNSPFPKAEMTALVGSEARVQYAGHPSFLERFAALDAFVNAVQPGLILLLINPHDAIAVSACHAFKGKIPMAFINHADHTFWLGSTLPDAVVDFRELGMVYTKQFRGIENVSMIPLTSQLTFDPNVKKENRKRLFAEYQVPAKATLSLSVATTYKILGASWSYLDSMIEVLRENPDHHHILVLSSGKDRMERYLQGSGVEERFHVSNAQNDLLPYYQGADFLIESFPFNGGMVRNDAFNAGLPVIVVENPRMPEHTRIQGLPDGYPVVADQEALLALAAEFINSAKIRGKYGRMLKKMHTAHFTREKIEQQMLDFVAAARQFNFPKADVVGLPKPATDFAYYRDLSRLVEAEVAFFDGRNADGLRTLQKYFDNDNSSEDYRRISQMLKYSHIGLDYGLRDEYKNALIEKEKGKVEAATAQLKAIAAKVPTFSQVYLQLAECYVNMGQQDDALQAIELFSKYASGAHQKAEALCTFGRYLMRFKKYERAIAAYREALELMPENHQVIFWLAEAYFHAGQIQDCQNLLHSILNHPKSPNSILAGAYQLLHQTQRPLEHPADAASEPAVVSVVIPVFNKVELTRNCLETMFNLSPEKTSFEVIIVDNGSSDETPRYLKEAQRRYPQVKVITNMQNLGFSKACNIGAAAAKGNFLMFLNNDTEPKRGWLDGLVRILDLDNSVAAVGSKLLFPSGKIQHAGVVAVDNRGGGDPLVLFHDLYNLPGDDPRVNQLMEYTALTAASLLVRKIAFQLVGGFDEGYWNGYEDVDLCFKLRQRGWKLVYQPKSVLIHYESQSGPERFTKVAENIQRLHQRWLGVVAPDYLFMGDKRKIATPANRVKPYSVPQLRVKKISAVSDIQPLASIVILTFNQVERTKECLQSIEKYTTYPYEVIVVDNGSTDSTPGYLKKWAKQKENHHLILNKDNKGFAGGNNQGIAQAKGEYIVLLNNDTVVTEGWLKRLLAPFAKNKNIGLVGPKSNFVAGEQVELHVPYQSEAELQQFAREYASLFAGKFKIHHRLVGFCLAVKKAVIDVIGVLDEGFGKGNYEDDDFCLRASMAGFQMAIAEDVFIHHYGNASFKANKINYLKSLEENRRIFLEKWEYLSEPQPIFIDILFEEVRFRNETGDVRHMEIVLRKILSLDKRNKTAAEALYKLLMNQNKAEAALHLLETYVKFNPVDHEAHTALGIQFWENGKVDKAIDAFQIAIEVAPNRLDYLKNFADANIEAERFEAGVQMLTHIISEFPTDPEAYIKLANLFVEDGNLTSAESWLHQGLTFNRNHPDLLNALQILQQLRVQEAGVRETTG